MFQLEPGVVFLNHGSFGACPMEVLEACFGYQRTLERQPVRFMQREFPERMLRARSALAEFLGTQPDRLVFVANATTGMNVIARSVLQILQPGDEVLGTDLEYGAIDRAWEAACGDVGAFYRMAEIPLPTTAEEALESLEKSITAKTRVLTVSHITSTTALQLPVERIIALARERGIISVIDGAHAPGQIPLNLDELGADFYAGNCHKWMMAPKASGFLHVHPAAEHLVRPVVVSWGRHSLSEKPFVREFDYQGTQNVAPALAVEDAIRFMETHDWRSVRQCCDALGRRLEAEVCELLGTTSLYGRDDTLRPPQMNAVMLPGDVDVAAVKAALWEDYRIEIPITPHPATGVPCLRVSWQGYNSKGDGDALRSALGSLVADRHPGSIP